MKLSEVNKMIEAIEKLIIVVETDIYQRNYFRQTEYALYKKHFIDNPPKLAFTDEERRAKLMEIYNKYLKIRQEILDKIALALEEKEEPEVFWFEKLFLKLKDLFFYFRLF